MVEAVMPDNLDNDARALLPYMAPLHTDSPRGVEGTRNQASRQLLVNQNQTLMLFGADILTPCTQLGEFMKLDNQTGDSMSGRKARDKVGMISGKTNIDNQVELTLSLGSDPFNLDPFIFGDRELVRKTFKRRPGRNRGSRRLKSPQFVPPELRKRMEQEMDYIGGSHATKKCASSSSLNVTTVEADDDHPHRAK